MNAAAAARQVSKNEFYARMNPLNVHPRIVEDHWPYTSTWELQPSRLVIGKSVGQQDGSYTYFLAA